MAGRWEVRVDDVRGMRAASFQNAHTTFSSSSTTAALGMGGQDRGVVNGREKTEGTEVGFGREQGAGEGGRGVNRVGIKKEINVCGRRRGEGWCEGVLDGGRWGEFEERTEGECGRGQGASDVHYNSGGHDWAVWMRKHGGGCSVVPLLCRHGVVGACTTELRPAVTTSGGKAIRWQHGP